MKHHEQYAQPKAAQAVSRPREMKRSFEAPQLVPRGSLVPMTGDQNAFSAFAAQSG